MLVVRNTSEPRIHNVMQTLPPVHTMSSITVVLPSCANRCPWLCSRSPPLITSRVVHAPNHRMVSQHPKNQEPTKCMLCLSVDMSDLAPT